MRDARSAAPRPEFAGTGLREDGPHKHKKQAKAKARAKGPADKKGRARVDRERRAEQNAKIREGMRTGDERYLPARDKGPVRRFTRDYVDARLCIGELLLPMLLLIIISQGISPSLSNGLWAATILLVAFDTALLVFRLRGELRRRFPDTSTKGAVGYAVLRSTQFRKIRMPKTQVKLGQKLPERY